MFVQLLINCKCYPEGTGEHAVALARVCERVSKELDVSVGLVVQAVDLYRVRSQVSLPVYCQHLDAVSPGAYTGALCALGVSRAGAAGVLLNHSEKRLSFDALEGALKEAKYHGMDVVVCASDVADACHVAILLPDVVAVEPPELIGGKVSVSTARPELIRDSVAQILEVSKRVKIFVGAGVHTKDDVSTALRLGAHGVLVSSGVVLAKNSEAVLRELCEGFK